MAQTLATIDRFRQKLPTPPVQRLLTGGLVDVERFAAGLSALTGFSDAALAQMGQPAFPAQLETPGEPIDVLPPLGSLPGQLSGLSGAAPVLAPRGEAPVPTTYVRVVSVPAAAPHEPASRPAAQAAAPEAAVQRAVVRPGVVLPVPSPDLDAVSIAAIQPFAVRTLAEALEVEAQRSRASLTQVLPPELTLTGNVLPSVESTPVQRSLGPATEEWVSPSALFQPPAEGGDRVSVAQRQSIDDQRGQGRPLEPETRQRFEQSYGQPLGDVRVHTGSSAHSVALSLNAIAFATGNDLFFTQDSYAPDRAEGLSLIGHELAHVIQQQYGVAGDPDALRPPNDAYEQHADRLAARALEAPTFWEPPAARDLQPETGQGTVQRSIAVETEHQVLAAPLPSGTWTAPGDQLSIANRVDIPSQPLGAALPASRVLPEEAPIQRYSLSQVSSLARPSQPARPAGTLGIPTHTGAHEVLPSSGYPRPDHVQMLTNFGGLDQILPGLRQVSGDSENPPVLRRIGSIPASLGDLGNLGPNLNDSLPRVPEIGLPAVGSMPGETQGASSQTPSLPTFGELPDLAGAAPGLGGIGLPQLPAAGASLPSLAGLPSPDMPLAPGPGEAAQAAGGALAQGQPAMATITGAEPTEADGPAAPPLPSLEKLTEHIWKQVQHKLKVERERSRGLA